MTVAKSASVFGVRDLQILKMLTDVAGSAATYDTTWIDIPGVKSISMEKQTKSIENRGDEQVLDTEEAFEYINVSWENAEIPMDAICLIEGAATPVSTAGTPSTQVLIEAGTNVGNYFKMFFLAKRGDANVKDVGCELFKVRGTLSYTFKGEDYAVCSFKGKAIPIKGKIATFDAAYRRLTFADGTITVA